jgi:hypothetical protein
MANLPTVAKTIALAMLHNLFLTAHGRIHERSALNTANAHREILVANPKGENTAL